MTQTDSMAAPPAAGVAETHFGLDQRQARILEAAERCFARGGFHRTTMADVAQEAAMSAGNIYRYFTSKDEVVARLCEVDRASLAADFEALIRAEDPFSTFRALGRRHLVDEPRERSMLVAEIWAEAARNPRVSEISRAFDADIRARFAAFLASLKQRGLMRADVDEKALIELLLTLIDGVIVRRARDADFDAAPFVDAIGDIMSAASASAMPSLLSPPGARKDTL